jgi:hypothetical protein
MHICLASPAGSRGRAEECAPACAAPGGRGPASGWRARWRCYRSGHKLAADAGRTHGSGSAGPPTRVRCVSIFLDKNRRYIGKSQSEQNGRQKRRNGRRTVRRDRRVLPHECATQVLRCRGRQRHGDGKPQLRVRRVLAHQPVGFQLHPTRATPPSTRTRTQPLLRRSGC